LTEQHKHIETTSQSQEQDKIVLIVAVEH